VIEAHVNNQVFPRRVANRPKISDSIALQEWLREVPNFSGARKPMEEYVGNRQ
jgi:hypothetical protein